MDCNIYEMIFKRKSVRRHDRNLKISDDELEIIYQKMNTLVPYDGDIKTAFLIVPSEKTSCNRGEYCLAGYSEKKGDYLLNMGYMLEQMDLFFPFLNVGACWQSLSKPELKKIDGLDYVIMLSFGKSAERNFRSRENPPRRKSLNDIWEGEYYKNVGKAVKLSPSAINSQPWRVKSFESKLEIYRTTSLFPLYPRPKMHFFNTIDMGIFCYILEVCLEHEGFGFERGETPGQSKGLIPVTSYNIK
ncbi:MAG: nitroreductase [Clostridiales bacterium]|jgi:hypothetical protein|nr:nitroreductase [Clostridiales bacterium]